MNTNSANNRPVRDCYIIYVRVPLYNAVLININEYVCINSDRQVHIFLNILNYKHVLKISSYRYTY